MTNERKPYKTYTKEFKLEAIRLMEDTGIIQQKMITTTKSKTGS